MHRAFLSLYILIVSSVVLVGLGFDALLGRYAPDDAVSPSDRDLFEVLELRVQAQAPLEGYLLDGRVSLYQLADLASTHLASQLIQGELVVVHNGPGERQLFKRVTGTEWVLAIAQPYQTKQRSSLYNLLLVVFYLLLAVVVFIWVWPLSRDLRALEVQTRLIGQDHLAEPLNILPTSPVYDLAASFTRMSERVKSLLASHKEMTYAVSHELRTPLARMKFALAMALQQAQTLNQQQQIDGLQQDVAEMDALVNQLLAYAGFEHNTQALNQQTGDMGALITELLARMQDQRSHLLLSFDNQMRAQNLTCEWHLMERALVNLLQNAERFAHSKIRVSLTQSATAYQIEVEDDGPGVAPEDRARIFESFVRLTNETNAQVRGFGLGLAIVQRIAQWHKGDVTVTESALGGARFSIRWPKCGQQMT